MKREGPFGRGSDVYEAAKARGESAGMSAGTAGKSACATMPAEIVAVVMFQAADRVKLNAGQQGYSNMRKGISPSQRRGTVVQVRRISSSVRVRWDPPAGRVDSAGIWIFVGYLERA